jgi:hypothetical protein
MLSAGIPVAFARASPHPRALAALALHHLVALLEQTFALAILAFLLLLDVRAFFTDHESLLPREGGVVRVLGGSWAVPGKPYA